MLDSNWLFEILQSEEFSKTDRILTVLLDLDSPEKTSKEIEDACLNHGLRPSNTLAFLNNARKSGKVAQVKNKRWKLTQTGRDALAASGIALRSNTVINKAREDLRDQLQQITNTDTRKFVEEAIRCLEANLLRSAVVMSWIGVVAVLYDHVLNNCLDRFNSEGQTRFPKGWKQVTRIDDFTLMKERDFIEVLVLAGVINKPVKEELCSCLDRRNGCGHPNTYQIGEQTVAHHIEVLINNVYSKF